MFYTSLLNSSLPSRSPSRSEPSSTSFKDVMRSDRCFMSVLVICSLVSVHGMVLVNYRVAGGISLHDQKFVFRGIREKVSHHRRKTLNANKPSRFQRVFVDYCVRRADNGKVPAFRSGFERNVVVKLGAGRGGSKIHVRRGGRSVFELALLIVHVLFRSGIGVVSSGFPSSSPCGYPCQYTLSS